MRTIPIIVGVTGHRDVLQSEVPNMKIQFQEFLKQLSCEYKDSEIIVATGLARGCDTYAVEAAIEKSYKYIGVLPMPKSEYEKDFTDSKPISFLGKEYNNELELFNVLCHGATYIHEGPYYLDKNNMNKLNSDDVINAITTRNLLYEDQGKRLAEHSDYLVAFFDQSSKLIKGGTAHVLKMRFTGECSPDLNKSKLGEMVGGRKTMLIPIKRESSVNNEASSDSDIEEYTVNINNIDQVLDSNKENITEMDKYNTFNKKANNIQEQISYEEDKLPECPNIKLDESTSALYYINKLYVDANYLSIHSKSSKSKIVGIFFTLILLSIFSFEIYGIFERTELLSIYICLYLLILLGYRYFFNIGEKHEDFVEYRVLAELLRIQYYWNIAGLNKQIIDYFPLKSRESMGWIKQALRSVQIMTESQVENTEYIEERLEFVCKNWITDQKNYYFKNKKKHKNNTKKGDKIVKIGFSLGFLTMIIVVAALIGWGLDAENMLVLCLVSFSGIITASTALYSDKISVESFEELSQRYEMMSKAYERAEKSFKNASIDLKKELVFEIGVEAMNEQSDWLYFQQSKEGKLY